MLNTGMMEDLLISVPSLHKVLKDVAMDSLLLLSLLTPCKCLQYILGFIKREENNFAYKMKFYGHCIRQHGEMESHMRTHMRSKSPSILSQRNSQLSLCGSGANGK